MVRRLNYSNKCSDRSKEQNKADLKRNKNAINQRLLIIIACEGEKTERYYFEALFGVLKNKQVLSKASCIIAPHQHTNPTGVLTDLRTYKSANGQTYTDYEYRWIVIDRDKERCGGGGHTLEDFNKALSQAQKNKISVAWSNPCFEIWYLLHYHYRNTPIERDEIASELSKAMKIPYEKNNTTMYEFLESKLNDAIRNAKKLLSDDISPAEANPGTTVHKLVELLIKLQES